LFKYIKHSPLNATISSVSVLQITAERTDSLVEGEQITFVNTSIPNWNQTDPLYRPDPILYWLGFNFDGAARLFTVPGLSFAYFTYSLAAYLVSVITIFMFVSDHCRTLEHTAEHSSTLPNT